MPTPNANTQDRRKQGAMERHIQSIVQAVIVALLLWVGATLLDVQKATIEATTSLVEVKNQISQINSRFDRYPTRDEVEARFETANNARIDLSHRVDALERKDSR